MAIASLMLVGFTLHLGYLWAIGDTENADVLRMISMSPAESIKRIDASGFVLVVDQRRPKPTNTILLGAPQFLSPLCGAFTYSEPRGVSNKRLHLFYLLDEPICHQGRNDCHSQFDCEHRQELSEELGILQKRINFPTPMHSILKKGKQPLSNLSK